MEVEFFALFRVYKCALLEVYYALPEKLSALIGIYEALLEDLHALIKDYEALFCV